VPVNLDDVARLAGELPGVRAGAREGWAEWRYHGRIVARQIDDRHLVIRADFDYRDAIVGRHPATFSVPRQYVKHMMVVADLDGDRAAVEDALEAAWRLQCAAD
jgi:hypothetical protein